MKYLILLYITFTIECSGLQKERLCGINGTTIIVAFPKDSIVLAADTRINQKTTSGHIFKKAQKIRTSGKYVFGFSGLQGMNNEKQQQIFSMLDLFEGCIKKEASLTKTFETFHNKLMFELKKMLTDHRSDVSVLLPDPKDSSFCAAIIFYQNKNSIDILTGKFILKTVNRKLHSIYFKRDTIKSQIYALGEIENVQNFMSKNPYFINSKKGNIGKQLTELIKMEQSVNSDKVHCPFDVITINRKTLSKKYTRFSCE